DVTREMRADVQALIDRTTRPNYVGHGRDVVDSGYSRLVVDRVEVVENSLRWRVFRAECDAIARHGGALPNVPRSLETLEFPRAGALLAEANEVYLFHAPKWSTVP